MRRNSATRVALVCRRCGREHSAYASQITPRNPRYYCSRACAYASALRPLQDRVWAKVNRRGRMQRVAPELGRCWNWTGAFTSKGYGKITANGAGTSNVNAHRYTFGLAYGPIPAGFFVCHVCDNPACVRNDSEGWYEVNGVLRPRRGHLFLGTVADNLADMRLKGRAQLTGARGADNFHAKLTEQEVRTIRRLYAAQKATGSVYGFVTPLAKRYGISRETLHAIVKARGWRHID